MTAPSTCAECGGPLDFAGALSDVDVESERRQELAELVDALRPHVAVICEACWTRLVGVPEEKGGA